MDVVTAATFRWMTECTKAFTIFQMSLMTFPFRSDVRSVSNNAQVTSLNAITGRKGFVAQLAKDYQKKK